MNTLLLLIIGIPIIEIYLFIKIGSQIGAFNTISLIFITAFLGIKELEPGHRLIIKRGDNKIEKIRYFVPKYDINNSITEKDAIDHTEKLLFDAVSKQLVSDVPLGVMLSGGLDSSTLVALMAKVRGDSNFHTFSLGFEEKSFDESSFADIVAKHIGTKHHRVLVNADDIINLIDTAGRIEKFNQKYGRK